MNKEIAKGQNKEETEHKVGNQILFLPVLITENLSIKCFRKRPDRLAYGY